MASVLIEAAPADSCHRTENTFSSVRYDTEPDGMGQPTYSSSFEESIWIRSYAVAYYQLVGSSSIMHKNPFGYTRGSSVELDVPEMTANGISEGFCSPVPGACNLVPSDNPPREPPRCFGALEYGGARSWDNAMRTLLALEN